MCYVSVVAHNLQVGLYMIQYTIYYRLQYTTYNWVYDTVHNMIALPYRTLFEVNLNLQSHEEKLSEMEKLEI